MFSITLPYDKGTFVKIVNPTFERKQTLDMGTISGYCVFSPTEFTVFVSGYKESWCGEYLPSEIVPLSEEEMEEQRKLELAISHLEALGVTVKGEEGYYRNIYNVLKDLGECLDMRLHR